MLTQPFYSHYTGKTVLASTPVKKWRILVEQSFTARMPMPLLTANNVFGSRRRPHPNVLHGVTYTISI